jgi:DNA-binding MarR family transcriptional regulator
MGKPDGQPALGAVLEFLRVVWAVDHGLQRVSKRLEGELGVTAPQRFVLRIVGRSPGIAAGDLARILHVHPSTLTGVVRRLEERGLLVRVPDPHDGRRALLRLSRTGKKLDVNQAGTVEAAVKHVLARTSRADADATHQVLADVARELERELARS